MKLLFKAMVATREYKQALKEGKTSLSRERAKEHRPLIEKAILRAARYGIQQLYVAFDAPIGAGTYGYPSLYPPELRRLAGMFGNCGEGFEVTLYDNDSILEIGWWNK